MRATLVLFVLVALGAVGCMPGDIGTSDPPGPPQAPVAEPSTELKEYSLGQQQVTRELERLQAIRSGIESQLEHRRLDQESHAGPRFPGEPSAVKEQILEKCEELEEDARKLSSNVHLAEYSGGTSQVNDHLRYVEEVRKKLGR